MQSADSGRGTGFIFVFQLTTPGAFIGKRWKLLALRGEELARGLHLP